MTHHVQIRVLNRKGAPLNNERVSLLFSPVSVGSGIPDQRTDPEGIAVFDVDVDDRSEVTVYVRGKELSRRAPLREHYELSL